MTKVKVRDFFLRISEELPNTRFNWLSVVERDINNRILAEVEVMRGSLICKNPTGINVYGRIKRIREISGSEWVHRLSVRKKVMGPIFDLETFL